MINLYQIYYFFVMSDNEENESEHNIEKEDIEEEDEEIKQKIQSKKKIPKGSDYFHILPAKFQGESSYKAHVDSYFETQIVHKKADDYRSQLRGRLLNGKKVNANNTMTYVELEKIKGNEYKVNQTRNINEYFIWKYDENVSKKDPMCDLNKFLSKFDMLS